MTIDMLTKVVPPPAAPDEPFSGLWGPLERDLGTPLPQDYKDFCRVYGSGHFMNFLNVYTPGTWSPHVRLGQQVHVFRQYELDPLLGDMRADELPPYAFWPDPGGLIVCGSTDWGDNIFWLPSGPPDKWGIVVAARGQWRFEAFDGDLTNFLTRVAICEIKPQDFPGDLDDGDPEFRPYSSYGPRRDDALEARVTRNFATINVKHSWKGWRRD
jgi:hypothetical protein